MKRKSFIIDLTSLLDIVLILLFVLFLNVAYQKEVNEDENEKVQQELQAKIDKLEEDMSKINIQNEKVSKWFDDKITKKDIYQLDYISNKFYFIDIYIDNANDYRIFINDKDTNIQIPIEIVDNKEVLSEIKLALYEKLDEVLDQKKGGYEFALITLNDDGKTYKFAYDLVWQTINKLQKDLNDDNIFKLQFLQY